jgi:CheY-like chemotaxis protein
MAKTTVLFADNDLDFLEIRKEFLEQAGYQVIPAADPTEARRILEQGWIDLAVIDIRLMYDDDEKDVSGLTLVREPTYRAVPKIILTGFPTYHAVREALGPTVDGLPPAVDFLAKQEGPEALINAVMRASQQVKVNYELTIAFAELQSFHGWARRIVGRALDETELNYQAQEIEKLIRKLFYYYTDIILDGVPTGRQGVVLAWVRSKGRPTEGSRLLKLSTREAMRLEKATFERWGSAAREWALKPAWKESVHFGVVVYPPISSELEPVQWLAEYFRWHQAEEISRVLEDFADRAGGSLYAQPCPPNQERSLNSLYKEQMGLTPEHVSEESFRQAIQEVIEHMRLRHLVAVDLEPDSDRMTLHLSDGSEVICTDPTRYIYRDAKRFDPPVLCRLTLGNIDGYNILVDRQGRAWLTDFATIGPAPTLSDFIALEARIRFEWIETTDLGQLRDFEAYLTIIRSLEEPLEVKNVEAVDLEKALKVLSRLRQLAASVPGADPIEYHFGILFQAARIIVADAPPDHKVHALLAAAMICEGLSTWEPY